MQKPEGKNRMDKRPGVIRPLFNRMAATYDRGNRTLSLLIDQVWRRRTVSALSLRDGQYVLDIATGTADMALEAARQADCRIAGIDLSEEMLRIAREKNRRSPFPGRCFFLQGDGTQAPFRDESFDHAMISFGIRNVQDMDRLFRETLRVLKPGGRFAILEFSLPETPVIRQGYLFYFKKVLPLIGAAIAGKKEPYFYLRDSVLDFEPPKALEQRILRNGFRLAVSRPFTFGICRLYVAEKL
ncbi:MAG TPA: bifunctional demethylmenaquinone methyltransferase/2-methoxy-6-polyprenyl-1,4-benzoquinol methylase UbiE [Syntrophales bacterium]|nr:bifunctional demethylmenaquinone methyltransferase/2-methoxy-6-polyprenyl-1,4-benzoquinol methylase UbiE [Syntrophobacterales bacterium]HQL89713.1 bifunctional demethylmenaquinone methyltransferase/2-methoxy-6-polyprenyl-1,4-benzoquinol methylase UbiE [Syntrophales bacterium]